MRKPPPPTSIEEWRPYWSQNCRPPSSVRLLVERFRSQVEGTLVTAPSSSSCPATSTAGSRGTGPGLDSLTPPPLAEMLFKAFAVPSRPRSQQVVLLCAEHRVGGGVDGNGQLDPDQDGLVRRNFRAGCLAPPVGDPPVCRGIARLHYLRPAFEAGAPGP